MDISLKLKIFFCLFFLAFLRASDAAESDYQCFVPGECILSQHIELVASTDEVQCLKLCQSTMDCTWFTFYPETGSCQLFANCAIIDDTQCPVCKTGQKECSIPGPVCWVKGQCLGNVIHTEEKISSKEKCLSLCQNFILCNWFTYFVEKEICILMTTCPHLDESCSYCLSGESTCSSEPQSYTKLLVAAGLILGPEPMDSIEIIDLGSSSTSCQDLASLPQSVYGAVGGLTSNNNPIICGANNEGIDGLQSFCSLYKGGVWNSSPSMITPRIGHASIAPANPNAAQTLIVTGGFNDQIASSLNTVEVLTDAGWQEISNYFPVTIWLHCMVVINSTTIFIIGGIRSDSEDYPNINTFYFNIENGNWIEGPNLLSARYQHSCGKIKMDSGSSQYSVIVAGGYNGPLLSFDHQTYYMSSVEILDFGAKEWRNGPSLPIKLSLASMVEDSVGGVVLIGGSNGTDLDTLYRLPHANSEWVLMPQKLKVGRSRAAAFFVPDEITNCN